MSNQLAEQFELMLAHIEKHGVVQVPSTYVKKRAKKDADKIRETMLNIVVQEIEFELSLVSNDVLNINTISVLRKGGNPSYNTSAFLFQRGKTVWASETSGYLKSVEETITPLIVYLKENKS